MKRQKEDKSVFLEASFQIKAIATKRQHLLRTRATHSLSVMHKAGSKIWLKVSVPSKGSDSELTWDLAHDMSERIRSEFGEFIYVEPADQYGRFGELLIQPMALGGSMPPSGVVSSRQKLIFPKLRQSRGWAELPACKQAMFEVEAAQMSQTTRGPNGVPMLFVHPGISRRLRRFLEHSEVTLSPSAATAATS